MPFSFLWRDARFRLIYAHCCTVCWSPASENQYAKIQKHKNTCTKYKDTKQKYKNTKKPNTMIMEIAQRYKMYILGFKSHWSNSVESHQSVHLQIDHKLYLNDLCWWITLFCLLDLLSKNTKLQKYTIQKYKYKNPTDQILWWWITLFYLLDMLNAL